MAWREVVAGLVLQVSIGCRSVAFSNFQFSETPSGNHSIADFEIGS